MSKKKSFSGSTMTLKDFHGGSIPSDIPLPSAPGVLVRPADRPSFDRQGSWGNPMGRADHRLRPSSSGSIRSLDDKTPFLSNTAHIGRNFDEDERKPLDGASGPRRTVSDESIAAPEIRMELRSDVGRSLGHQGSAPLSSVYNPGGGPYSARVSEGGHMSSNSWSSGGGGGNGHGGVGGVLYPNAWGVRKDLVGVAETVPSPYVGQSNVTKFAQASALEKVSSGRWQTKPFLHQADVEVISQAESPNRLHPRGDDAYHGISSMNEREYSETMLVRHVERGLNMEESTQNVVKEVPGGERIRSPVFMDVKERNSGLLTGEASARPKLKLLPRTKPLGASELSPNEYKQKFQQPNDSSHLETASEILGDANHVKVKPGLSADGDGGNQLAERPKLNLKPRSQPFEQAEQSAGGVRMALFGGARPRELVLKERGVDDVVNSQEVVQSPIWVKNDSSRIETMPVHSNAVLCSERTGNANLDHRTGKSVDRREQRAETEKSEAQRKNWRNENWRSSRDTEKQHNLQHQQERPPSPETWRKPVEQQKPANTDTSGLRYGKAASPVELAQAFSRSVSDPKQKTEQFSGPKDVPGRTQVPFSRLTGPTTRPQINGY